MILHVSGDPNMTFKDGYHLFKIVKANGTSNGKRLVLFMLCGALYLNIA